MINTLYFENSPICRDQLSYSLFTVQANQRKLLSVRSLEQLDVLSITNNLPHS